MEFNNISRRCRGVSLIGFVLVRNSFRRNAMKRVSPKCSIFAEGISGSHSYFGKGQNSARRQDQQEWQCLKEVARSQVDAVVKVPYVCSRQNDKGCQHQPVSSLRAACQKRDSQECQREIKWPPEEIDL